MYERAEIHDLDGQELVQAILTLGMSKYRLQRVFFKMGKQCSYTNLIAWERGWWSPCEEYYELLWKIYDDLLDKTGISPIQLELPIRNKKKR